MIEFTFAVDVKDGERQLHLVADRLEDVEGTLRRYGQSYLRSKIDLHFETRQGWPERAKATQQRAAGRAILSASRSEQRIRQKLTKELRRARKSLGRVESIEGFDREQRRQEMLASTGKRSQGADKVLRGRLAAVERRELVLAEFNRLAAGGSRFASLTGDKAGSKRVAKLGERIERAVEQTKTPLGRIASSMKLEIKGSRLVYGSEIKWAWVHNQGGTAGHGAQIPQRAFAYLEPEDLDVLVDMFVGDGVAATVT